MSPPFIWCTMKLCLNMIVKNEGERIERALASVAPFINSWVIVDTGSTDDTKEKIVAFFKNAGIFGEIRDLPFEDFSQARNGALTIARALTFAYEPDYFLLMDADMELVVKDPIRFLGYEGGPSYEMYQHAGGVHYTNSRLVSVTADPRYRGVTHEYLDVPTSGRIPEDVAYFVDHADGANRPDKFKRDIRLLKKGLQTEPNNARYFYYLASSYRDAGKHAEAAKWFKRRVDAGGWNEEVWSAQLGYAHALKALGDNDGFISNLLIAYNLRPTRAEAMYDLAHYLRENDQPAPALAAAEAVLHLSKTTDSLFVNDYVYAVGIKEEIAITSFYVPGKFEQGRKVNDALSMVPGPYWSATNTARANQFHYLRPLSDACPSFDWRNLAFTPPDGLVPLNPSVCNQNGSLIVNVRAVNYTIDPEGRYIIKGTDGTANRENPIDTRNFLVGLGVNPLRHDYLWSCECYRPGNMPVEWPLVTGFEDIRLIPRGEDLYASATVRQLCADGQCEQVQTKLIGFKPDGTLEAINKFGNFGYMHEDMKRMLREPRATEKNWAPVLWGNVPFYMDRPGHVVSDAGVTIMKHEQGIAVDNISGSSQVIPFGDGWIAITHTAHPLPNEPYKRYYAHRFIEYTVDFRVKRMSLPFYFHDRVIEFCAGMCYSIGHDQFVISYGFKDNEARIATVSVAEVERFLEGGHSYA